MHAYTDRRGWRTVSDQHIADLMEVLGELLAVPELHPSGPEEVFSSTLETIAKARVIRDAVLDELSPCE